MSKKQNGDQPERKFKYITQDDVNSLEKLNKDQLVEKMLSETRSVKAVRKLRKDDPVMSKLKKDIKEHREKNTPDRITKLKLEIKELKAEVDAEIAEDLFELKEKGKDYKIDIGTHQELLDETQRILEKRSK